MTSDGSLAVFWRDVTERHEAQEALRQSDEKYRALFQSIDEAFGLLGLIHDEAERAVDFRYLEVNDAFERHTGHTGIAEKLRSEVSPGTQSSWLDIYAEVARTGQAKRFEDYRQDTGRWYDVYASRVGQAGSREVAVLIKDITDRKEDEARQAFLLNLGDALRPLTDPVEVQVTAARLLAQHLGANQAQYRETMEPDVRLLENNLAGRTAVCHDIDNDPTVIAEEAAAVAGAGFHAYIAAPLVKAGALVATLAVHSMAPRAWTAGEIALVEETAERTWAAVQRARVEASLRESGERQAFLLRLSDALRPVGDPEEIKARAARSLGEHLGVNRAFYAEIEDDNWMVVRGYEQGVAPLGEGAHPAARYGPWIMQSYRAGERLVFRDTRTDPRFAETERKAHAAADIIGAVGVPLVKEGVLVAILAVHTAEPHAWSDADIRLVEDTAERTWAAVERARAEAALRESEERHAFLVRFSDAVRGLTDPVAVATTACRMLLEKLDVDLAHWGEVDWTTEEFVTTGSVSSPGVRPIEGRFPLAAWEPYNASHREGRAVVVNDTQTDPRADSAMRAATAGMEIGADLAAPVVVAGRLASVLAVKRRQPRRWTSEEIALVESVAGRCWAEVERARAEAALRASEAKYRTLFESIDEGFLTLDVIYDRDGRPVDARYLETNPAAVKLMGADLTGHRLSEVLPGSLPDAIEIYDCVARTRIAEHHERHYPPSNRWYDAHISPVATVGAADDARRVAVVFQDITDHKRLENALRARAERQAFLLKFSDALRAAPDEASVAKVAIDLIVAQLEVDRCWMTVRFPHENRAVVSHEYRRHPGLVSMRREYKLSDFPSAARRLETGTLVLHDIQTDASLTDQDKTAYGALAIGAQLAVRLRRGEGRAIWSLAVADDAPRHWTPQEAELLEEAAERTWAAVERARTEAALRASEARRELALQAAEMGAWDYDLVADVCYFDPRAREMYGLPSDSLDHRLDGVAAVVHPDDVGPMFDAITHASNVDGDDRYEIDYRIARSGGGYRWLRASGKAEFEGVGAARKAVRIVGASRDVTLEKEAERRMAAELAATQRLQAFSMAFISGQEPEALYAQLLDAAIALLQADAASVQLLDPDGRRLSLLASRHFHPESAAFWQWVDVSSHSVCGVALETNARVLVEDVEGWAKMSGTRDLDELRRSGLRAVQSTPLNARDGRRLGMLSTHWREPHRPTPGEFALFDVLARQAADLIERNQSEAALRESEEKFRTVFESMDEGFLVYDMIRDASGRVVDYRLLEVNPAHQRATGLPRETIGKLGSEFMPDVEPYWLELFDRVATSGVAERAEMYNAPTSRWYNVQVSPVSGHDRVAIVFDDVSARKRAEVEREQLLVTQAVAAERQALLKRIVRAQEEERAMVAREVHDSVTQLAHAAAIHLDNAVEALNGTPMPVRIELERGRDLTRQAANEARRLIAGLRPQVLDVAGLSGAIEAEAESLRRAGWDVEVIDRDLLGVRLDPEVEITLFRVAQEALSNIRKHAGASKVRVDLRRDRGHIRLEVRDWGRGFDPRAVRVSADGEHVGLTGMRERMLLVGGQFEIRSRPGSGATVRATLPIPPELTNGI